MTERKPIFYDEQQRRWRRTRRLLEAGGVVFTLLLFTFFFSLIGKLSFPEVLFPKAGPVLHAVHDKPRPAKPVPRRLVRKRRVAALGKVPQNYDPLRAAFYVPWDFTSLDSLKQHYRNIDVLIPEALHAVSSDGRLDMERDPKLWDWLRTSGVELPTMALVNNFDGADWRSPELAALLSRPGSRERLKNALVLYARTTRQAGLVVDFEEVPFAAQVNFEKFIAELEAPLHEANLKLMVALPAADSDYNYAHFAAHCDAIILMNYDEHWLASPPGPITAQDWYVRNMNAALKLIPKEKLVMGIANYAYDWTEGVRGQKAGPNRGSSFQAAIVTAQESDAQVEFDSESLNPQFSYEEAGRTHRVWMLDAVTAYNEERAAERAGVRGTALWRLGSEDPSLWPIWDVTNPADDVRAKIQVVPPAYDLVLEGDGDIWRITATPQPGKRVFTYDRDSDTFVDEKFTAYPLPYRIDQIGGLPKKIALTFDDGPDPRYTPRILDVLKEKHAPATFFVTGLEANASPNLLAREYAEGHEIGNHTYTHPRFDDISLTQLDLELKLTERLVESRLGVETRLFRPPYGIDHQPESADEVKLLPIPQKMGYVIVGSKIDPHDWGEPGGLPPPPANKIASRIIDQARKDQGHIVLMHDGGGNREATVAALPKVIDGLRAAGFDLVPVSTLLGQTRAETMPALSGGEWWLARADYFVFNLFSWLRWGIAWVFVLGIGLVSARALIVGVLAIIEKLRRDRPAPPDFLPRVSVMIPAYNEEDVIVETVSSVLASSYPHFEVIVVDDGSRDRTGERLAANFAGDPRVRIVRQPNQGKAAALNQALERASGEIIVTIDADTAIDREAIPKLVRHFADPTVGAVAGNAKVANRRRWLTRWQALEYITSQNLEKRAFDLLNCITVVPGAIGAWRASVLRQHGGFSHDTVAEDTDLTLDIRRDGWRIFYDEEAIARTQAPETAGDLIRQRFRWTFGTLQAVWKHRDTLGRSRYGTLGWIALPNIFLFQILLPLVSPVIDLLFLGSLALWGLAQLHIARVPQLWTAQDVERSFFFFAAFMLIDFLTCVIAFALEKKEDWSLLLPLLLQRFYYRQMMYVVLFRAVTRAVKGSAVGWGRVEPRTPARAASL